MDSKKSLKNTRQPAPRAKDPVAQFLGRRRWSGITKKAHSEFARKNMKDWWAKQTPAFKKARGKLMTTARMRKRRERERAKKIEKKIGTRNRN